MLNFAIDCYDNTEATVMPYTATGVIVLIKQMLDCYATQCFKRLFWLDEHAILIPHTVFIAVALKEPDHVIVILTPIRVIVLSTQACDCYATQL